MEARGGGVRIGREQHERAALQGVRLVHPGRCAHEAVGGLGDDEVAASADDSPRFLTYHLPLVAADDASFGLRDHLVRHDEDVALLEVGRVCDQRSQVVALPDLRQPPDRDHTELVQGRPVMRRPA